MIVSQLLWKFGKIKLQRKKVARAQKNTSYYLHKEEARVLIHSRLDFFAPVMSCSFNRVAIRDQKRCWGSCSAKSNLNFSYKLLFLPPCVRDYIIVHELCHLSVLNHSADFWSQVAMHMPDYADRIKTLRRIEKTTGAKISYIQQFCKEHTCPVCSSVK